MGLSEHEQRLLDEMERNLYKHEADIVNTSAGPRTVNYTKVASACSASCWASCSSSSA